jgi:hypothetical protein
MATRQTAPTAADGSRAGPPPLANRALPGYIQPEEGLTLPTARKSFLHRGVDTERKAGLTRFILQCPSDEFGTALAVASASGGSPRARRSPLAIPAC